jgi:hypothetical protein
VAIRGAASSGELPRRRAWAWLAHPLVLLLVGGAFTAGITNYLIPSITRQWQNHDKELEIKSELVQKMSESATSFIIVVTTVDFAPRYISNAELFKRYEAWEVERQAIASQIGAYFPKSQVSDEWDSFSEAVLNYFDFASLSASLRNLDLREQKLTKIERYLRERFPDLISFEKNKNDLHYQNALRLLEQKLLMRERQIVHHLLDSHSAF